MIDGDSEAGKRVALVANPSADLYGSDRMLLESVRGLREQGWEVVVATSCTGPLAAALATTGARLETCPAPVVRKSSLTPRGLVSLAWATIRGVGPMIRLVRRCRPDVVYVNTLTIPLWLMVARVLRVPCAIHVHEAETSAHPLATKGLALPTRLAQKVIYNSETSRAVAGALGRGDRAVVIPNGVALPGMVRAAARANIEQPRLLYVGRLSPRKGVDVAVEAVRVLRDRGVEASLDIVGSVFPGYEWYEDQLRAQVDSATLWTSVRFHGFQDDVWPHLEAADVVLVPSRLDESFGNTVVEAALAGRPVIVSDHTGLREASISLDSAIRVPVDDPAAVADALVTMQTDWSSTVQRAAADALRAAVMYDPQKYRSSVTKVLNELR